MTRNRTNESTPFTTKPESQVPVSLARACHESIHCLRIVTDELPSELRHAIDIAPDELVNWLSSAGRIGRTLAVLQTKNCLEFYTTDYDRRVVLRPVLETIARKVADAPGLELTRTVETTGIAAARQLLGNASEYATADGAGEEIDLQIQAAAALSAATAALGPVLSSLFRAAANVGRRVRQETLLNDPAISPELREVEALAVERIVEEELATWQAQEAEIERVNDQLVEIQQRQQKSFDVQEPGSEVRIRIGRAISLLPDIKQSAS